MAEEEEKLYAVLKDGKEIAYTWGYHAMDALQRAKKLYGESRVEPVRSARGGPVFR